MRSSPSWSPQTPFELQREEGDAHVVVGYYSAKPPEASEPGYRCIEREPPAKPTSSRRRGGGA